MIELPANFILLVCVGSVAATVAFIVYGCIRGFRNVLVMMDNKLTSGQLPGLTGALEYLRDHARSVNEYWATQSGINPSVSITCVKPSGTVSQLVDSASGIHARHNPFYIRRIRMDKKDLIYQYLKEAGCEVEDEVHRPDSTAVFSFAMKAPEGSVCRKDMTAIEQLELWLLYQRHWCEHKPSVTISVKDEEWPEVGAGYLNILMK